MTQLQPYGFFSAAAELALSWFADDQMYYAAMSGAGIGPEAYDEIPDRMAKAPKDMMEAYEQATYFVALAARRAADMEDESTKIFLQAQLQQLSKEGTAAQEGTNFICSKTGYWCPVRGSGRVLADTIQIIEDSSLPDEERVMMTTILRKSRRAVMIRQAIPWVIALGLGAGTYYWYSQRDQS